MNGRWFDDVNGRIHSVIPAVTLASVNVGGVSPVTKSAPASRLLMTVPGVGVVPALTFVATINDAGHLAKSRAVGSFTKPQ